MSEAALRAWPLGPEKGDETEAASEVETTPGGTEPVTWVVVWRTNGLLPAHIMADRLQAEGIPARAWQEGAGRALGLTVGLLGAGNVAVPKPFEEQARDLLSDLDDPSDADIPWQDEDDPEP